MLMSNVLIAGIAALTHATPPAHCRLHEANQLVHRWEGICDLLLGKDSKIRLKPAQAVASGRWKRAAEPTGVWAGDLSSADFQDPSVELELYGTSGVVRTENGWFEVSGYHATPTELTFDVDPSRTVAPSELDRAIVRRADLLLSSATAWNRADDRKCPASATTWSIYCAMEHASIETTCGAHHRRPA